MSNDEQVSVALNVGGGIEGGELNGSVPSMPTPTPEQQQLGTSSLIKQTGGSPEENTTELEKEEGEQEAEGHQDGEQQIQTTTAENESSHNENDNGLKQDGDAQPTSDKKEEASESFDAELEAMKKRLHQMEQETSTMQGVGDESVMMPSTASSEMGEQAETMNVDGSAIEALPGAGNSMIDETTADSDARSIYVGNVDYLATGEELNQYFHECGTINRVTIMCHKATGQPKGYAYIEFKERESVQNALILNESLFRGRQLKVVEKRTNIPGVTRGGIGRGRGRYNRGGWRGATGGFRGRPRGRGRGRGRWAPY